MEWWLQLLICLNILLRIHVLGNKSRGDSHYKSTPCPADRVRAEQSRPGDGLQLTLRFSFQPRLTRSVTTSENVSLAADMVKQAIKTCQSVL